MADSKKRAISDSSPMLLAIELEATALSCTRRNSGWMLGNTSSLGGGGVTDIGGVREMLYCGTWFSGQNWW